MLHLELALWWAVCKAFPVSIYSRFEMDCQAACKCCPVSVYPTICVPSLLNCVVPILLAAVLEALRGVSHMHIRKN